LSHYDFYIIFEDFKILYSLFIHQKLIDHEI
jgi:hypothetical protein